MLRMITLVCALIAGSAMAADQDTVWVMRSDGSKSCEPPGTGAALEEGARMLKSDRIPILKMRKGNDGAAHLMMCGADTGKVNAYLIHRKNLKKAQARGFRFSQSIR